MIRSLIYSAAVSLLFVTLSSGCADAPLESEQQREWLDEYGAQGPFETTGPAGKEDNAGRPGPQASWDNDDYQVWEVRHAWSDITDEAGLAWTNNSGLNWNQKYAAWLDSLETVEQPESSHLETFLLTTPEGQRLFAPVLECAEVAIFLRATFSAWHGLPFYLEASDGGKPIYLGHFGFRRHDGTSFGKAPRFRTRYQDYANGWAAGDPWPVDEKLLRRGLYGGGDEVDFLGTVDGQPARAGAYFDRIYLNKRVGHFMLLALSWFGSMHLADGANMFHVEANSIQAGDVLLLRWQRQGIGHTVPVMRVKQIEAGRLEVAVATGSMPRRYPKWEEGPAAGRYFKGERAGGFGENGDGDAYAKLGGGLRRWRVAEKSNGRYRNTFLDADADVWINSNSYQAIAQRTADFEDLLKELSPEEKRDLAVSLIESSREHLRNYPASCSARIKREEAFEQLYEVNETHFWKSEAETDVVYRTLEDYVFAALVYNQSRTCCWNSSTRAMYDLIMAYNNSIMEDESTRTCNPPVVFMARNISTSDDGYGEFRQFAESQGQGSAWVAWSADEDCPQSSQSSDDTLAPIQPTPWCTLSETSGPDASCGDTGDLNNPTPMTNGTFDGLRICSAETDHWAYTGSNSVQVTVTPTDGMGGLVLTVYNDLGNQLGRSPSRGRQPIGPEDTGPQSLVFNLDGGAGETVTIGVAGTTNMTERGYSLTIESL